MAAIPAKVASHPQLTLIEAHQTQAVRSQLTTPSGDSTEVPNRPSHRARMRLLAKSSVFDVWDHCTPTPMVSVSSATASNGQHVRRQQPGTRWPPPAHRTADRVADRAHCLREDRPRRPADGPGGRTLPHRQCRARPRLSGLAACSRRERHVSPTLLGHPRFTRHANPSADLCRVRRCGTCAEYWSRRRGSRRARR